MTGTLADENRLGAELEKRFSGRANKNGIRVDLNGGDVFHKIRFEQDGLAAEIQLEQADRLH
jgi:hypothetical protein